MPELVEVPVSTPTPSAAPPSNAAPDETKSEPAVIRTQSPVKEAKGMARFMEDMQRATAPKAPAPEVKEQKPEPQKTAEKTEPEPKPEAKPKPSVPVPKELRERLSQVEKERDELKSSYEKQIADLKSKSPDDTLKTQLEDYRKQLETLKSELAQSSYERSEEFKQKYQEPFNRSYQAACEEIQRLPVRIDDEHTRQATVADFNKILTAPVEDQGRLATELFGVNAALVLAHRNELFRMKREADLAVASRKGDFEKLAKEKEGQQRAQKAQFVQFHERSAKELEDSYPQFFASPKDDSELAQAIKEGYEFVDKLRQEEEKMPIDERAAYSAVIRARAAAFVPNFIRDQRKDAKIASLEKELAKLRGSDPGAGKQVSGDTQPKQTPKGIAGLTEVFKGLGS